MTSAVVIWDDEALTVLFECEDSQIVAMHPARDDKEMWRDDCVEVFLDPDHSHNPMSRWFHVLVSASGGVSDEQGPVAEWLSNGAVVSGNAGFDARGVTTKVERTPKGWSAKIRMPWKDIGAKPKASDVWGFNLNRTDHPAEDYLCYSPTRGAFHNINQWGHLVFADADGTMGGVTPEQLALQLKQKHDGVEKSARTIGGVTYDAVDPGEPFTPAPVPPQDWRPPEPSPAERAAGLMAYVTSDPGDYRPDRVPRPAEHASTLASFLTPDEYTPAWFGVRGLDDVQGLTVRVDTSDAPVSVDVRYMHFWPQRTGWKSRQWYITPELLLPCRDGKMQVPMKRGLLEERSFDLKTGVTAAFWLTLNAKADARAGTYNAVVYIQSKDRGDLALPLRIEILPFKLQRPADRSWALYCDPYRWIGMSDAQVMGDLRDFARHGMTGLIEIGLGRADLSGLKEGKASFDATSYRRLAHMAAEAGLPGPHIIKSWDAGAVRDVVAPGVNLERGDWPRAVKEGVAAVARAAVEATRGLPPWYYYGVDEPSSENTFAIQDYQSWHAGGAKTYATVRDIHFIEKTSAYISAPCFVSGLICDEKKSREAREACAKTGAEFWWYGTGSYVNPFPQESYLYHNRYGAGLLFWKSGAKAQATWAFCRPQEDAFNDFDGSHANAREPKEPGMVYPWFLKADDWSTYQGAIPTIAWEALREGVDDYAYLYTLTRTIAEARRHTDQAICKKADAAEAVLNALVEAVPWANCMNEPAFKTPRMQVVRRAVANEIVKLRAALAD
ncbi:MAG: carbohydrate-binding family 9-like protein [Planctomycetes bacterium]|nr:carbohydrate-binding family 9-like protein [Planctomycetota bacterium]